MVSFEIGPEGASEPFTVHKGICSLYRYCGTSLTGEAEFACYHSPVLDAAFNSSFIEGQTQTYRLEDVGINTFRLFVNWLYSGKIVLPCDDEVLTATEKHMRAIGEDDQDGDDDDYEGWPTQIDLVKFISLQDMSLVRLWILADRLIVPRLQNRVMDILSELLLNRRNRPVTSEWLSYAYQSTSAGSPLRDLALDVCLYKMLPTTIRTNPDGFPHQLLIDIATASVLKEVLEPKEAPDVEPQDYLATRYTHTRKKRNYRVIIPDAPSRDG